MDDTETQGYLVWDAFYTFMEQRCNGYRGRGQFWTNRYYKTFCKLGEVVAANQYDITDFITMNVQMVSKNHKYITPKDLLSADAIERYKECVARRGITDAAEVWKHQVTLLVDISVALIPKKYANEVELLLDLHMPFWAWFRVAYPSPIELRLFDQYATLAWSELQQDARARTFVRQNFGDRLTELERRVARFNDSPLQGGTHAHT